jgi:N-acylneuraminate cytidylyltransferase
MNRIAIIPARGGSKRVPGKNIKLFCGKPMIAWSIEVALTSELFDKVIVSTDDDEIAKVALEWGAEVPFLRPKELSDDYSGINEVVAHAVRWMLEKNEIISDICCIYATAPFICKEDLSKGLEILKQDDWEFVFSATTFSSSVFRSFQKGDDGSLEMLFQDYYYTRSQDLPVSFHDAGQFYWGKPEAWTSLKKVFDDYSTIVPISRWRVLDIDTDDDWKQAELMAAYLGISKK